MIHYLRGDATKPQGKGPKIIAHICNDAGGWGAGFVMAISARWPEPEKAYREWAVSKTSGGQPFALRAVQYVQVEPDLWVANMIAQTGYGTPDRPPIRYDALRECLKTLAIPDGSIHMPRIGCGLAGGDWASVEAVIKETLSHREVFVYDFEGASERVHNVHNRDVSGHSGTL